MKISIKLLLTAGLTACCLTRSVAGSKIYEAAYYKTAEIAEVSAAYTYDSIKVESNYRFDHAAVAATEAYARIVYRKFSDDKLNGIVKNVILSPLKVEYRFKNSFAAENPVLSNMNAINNAAQDYEELASNFTRQFETETPDLDLKAYWYADIRVKVISETAGYVCLICEKDYFTGGSHDLYDHIYLNYDRHAHRLLTLASLFKLDG